MVLFKKIELISEYFYYAFPLSIKTDTSYSSFKSCLINEVLSRDSAIAIIRKLELN